MLAERIFGFLVWAVISLFMIMMGSNLFAMLVNEQLRYLVPELNLPERKYSCREFTITGFRIETPKKTCRSGS